MNRKQFLKTVAGGTMAMSLTPNLLLAQPLLKSAKKLTILHTNDQHSRIEPFDASPDHAP